MNQIDHCLKITLKKNWIMKDDLAGKITKQFFEIRAKPFNYIIDGNSEDRKSKRNKKLCNKKKT